MNPRHGERRDAFTSPEYRSWISAKARVANPNNDAYERYGGRGIKMCDRWLNDFPAFLSDMGRRPSADHSLDRFPNNNGDYEPGNCRWATPKEQANNRRPRRTSARNRMLTVNGKTLCLKEWSAVTGLNYNAIRGRLDRGWQPGAAVTAPSGSAKRGTFLVSKP